MATTKHLILIGPMGAGKTSIGEAVSTTLGRRFLDSDHWIEEHHGSTSGDIAAADGVTELHAIELEALLAMASAESAAVIAPAESVVDSDTGARILAAHTTVWLDADPATLRARRGDDHRRTMTPEEVAARRAFRTPRLQDVAVLQLNTSSMSADDCAAAIVAHVRKR